MMFSARVVFSLTLSLFTCLPLSLVAAATGLPLATGKLKALGSVSSSSQVTDFTHYWNAVTPENGGKWGSVESTRDSMNWTELDAAYSLAKSNGYPFRMHTLIWGNQQPTWIASLSAAEQRQEIEQWFAAVAARYPDIDYIDVVNEPLHAPPRSTADGGNYLNALGGAGASGWEWVLQSFRLARLYFPRAQLVLNDYSIINSGTSTQQFLTIINLLRNEGLIDLIGEQAHAFTTKSASASTMTTNLNALAATGLPIWITEFDIDGTSDAVQLAEYQRVFPVLWEHPSVVGITLWGYRPGLWRNAEGAYLVQADGSERSALVWLKSYIAATNPDLLATILTQPANQSVVAGASAGFSVVASGSPLPAFQWRKNGVNINGAMNSTYAITNATVSDAGSYSVVVSNAGRSVVSNGATLTVSAAPPVNTYHPPSDFNADGQGDLVWQNTSTGERSIWLMNGTTLTAGVSLGLSPTEWSIAAVADFNADGKPDLLWQNTLTGDRTFWLMNGTTFGSSASLGTYSTDLMIAGAGDFNSDGKPDLVWQNTSTGGRSIWLMNGTNVSSVVDLGTLPPEWSIAGTGDFNADGKCDLIWQNTVTGERAIWLMNGTTVTAGVALGVYPQLQISGTGDYNSDGKSDILWTNTVTGERVIWLMNGTTMASSVSLGAVDLNWVLGRPVFRRALADFNNDGKSDIVWQNTTTGDRAIWIMNGIEARTGLSLGNYPVTQWIAAIGDFNNDGKADLVWQNNSTGARSITLLNGTTILSTVALGTYGTEWSINTTGDFNADGKPDLVWTNNATGDRAIWLMDGTTFTGGADLGNVSTQMQVVGTGDFNSDGQTDILWQNTSTGVRTIWLMNGTTHTSIVILGTYGPEWSIVGTGDYNADGKPDLLWQNTLTGERAIWLMSGTTYLSSAAVGTYDTVWSIRN